MSWGGRLALGLLATLLIASWGWSMWQNVYWSSAPQQIAIGSPERICWDDPLANLVGDGNQRHLFPWASGLRARTDNSFFNAGETIFQHEPQS